MPTSATPPDGHPRPPRPPRVRDAARELRVLERDNEALRRRVAELEASARAFRTLVEATSDAVFVTDLDMRIRSWNEGCERLFGRPAGDVVGATAPFLAPGQSQRMRRALLRVASIDEASGFELVAERADGSRFTAEMAAAPLADASGAVFGALVIVRGIGEDSRLERMQDDFVALVTQELKNPLTAIVGFAQLLSRRDVLDDPAKRSRAVRALEARGRQLTGLVDDLLLASRVERGELRLDRERADLAALVAETVTRFRGFEPEHRFVVEVETGRMDADLDVRRVTQAVNHLLTNAVEHTPPGGRIRVTLRRDAGAGAVVVSDTGDGIPPAELERVFDRFYAVPDAGEPRGGAGLGLYIVRMVAEAHGGTVAVVSRPGKGSAFTLRLPLAVS